MNAPIIKFKTDSYDEIQPIECIRETAKQLVVIENWYGKRSECKVNKSGSYHVYHDTWGDAHAFLLLRALRNLDSARRNLETAKGRLGNIKGMKQPESAK